MESERKELIKKKQFKQNIKKGAHVLQTKAQISSAPSKKLKANTISIKKYKAAGNAAVKSNGVTKPSEASSAQCPQKGKPNNKGVLKKLNNKKKVQKKVPEQPEKENKKEVGSLASTADGATKQNGSSAAQSPQENQTNKKADLKKLKKERQAQKKLQRQDEASKNVSHEKSSPDQTIFIGNLPINTKKPQLTRFFKSIGNVVSVRFVTASGKKLFKHKTRLEAPSLNSYVVFETAELAKKALSLNGAQFKTHHLRITESQKQCLNALEEQSKNIVVVGNLTYSAKEEQLRQVFTSCGEVEYVRCIRNIQGCVGVAYVCFKSPDSSKLAMELNGTMVDERPIRVEQYSLKKLAQKNADITKGKPNTKVNAENAKKRIDGKEKTNEEDDLKKKSKFHGVKVKGIKKKNKKNKLTKQMKTMAKKIAPKVKSA